MKRTACIVCGAPLYKAPIYVCKNMPSASQNLPTVDNIDEDKPVDFELCQCCGCGLVQFNNEPVSYYRDSTRAGERCDFLIDLRKKQYRHMIETYDLNGKKLVEIGAGKGGFLKTLTELSEYGIKEYGIEYNHEYVEIARNIENVNVSQGNPESADTVIDGAPFEAFTSFAYPARLIKPNEMLQCIYNNTTEDAVGLIMVPSMEHLLSREGYYDITADHIAYYDRNSLNFLIQKNGFEVLECDEVAGTYIYAYIKKRERYNLGEVWRDVDILTREVSKFIEKEKADRKKIAVWCAGHFAFTVLAGIESFNSIEYIIDNAEYKKEHFAPVSHIPIKGPENYAVNPVDTIMILGPMYADEIIDEIREKCSTTVTIVTVNKYGLQVENE